jgi:hypothetical protein
VLAYGSEAGTTKKTDENRFSASEIKFKRINTGYILINHKRN